MQDTVEAEDPSLAEEFGEPADPAETDLVARGPRVYLTETRNLLRPVVVSRLGDALRTKLPADTAVALDAAVAAALTARDMSWPRSTRGGYRGVDKRGKRKGPAGAGPSRAITYTAVGSSSRYFSAASWATEMSILPSRARPMSTATTTDSASMLK